MKRQTALTMSSLDNVAARIEELIGREKFDLERTTYDDTVIEWTVTTEDMCGVEISLVLHNTMFSIHLRPYVTNQWGDNIYFPTKGSMGTCDNVIVWFKQTFMYELYYVRSYRLITQNIYRIAKKAGFEGLCLPSKVEHGKNDNGIEYVTELFELEDTFNGVSKKIEVSVNAFKGKIFISTRCDGDWETVSRNKDVKRALQHFEKRMVQYLGQFDPHPRYYLMLAQNPDALGEKVMVFPVNRIKAGL